MKNATLVIGNPSGRKKTRVLGFLNSRAHHRNDVGVARNGSVDEGQGIMGMVGEGAAAETEVVVGTRDTASPRLRQVRGIREDGETHIRGAEDARAMPVDRGV